MLTICVASRLGQPCVINRCVTRGAATPSISTTAAAPRRCEPQHNQLLASGDARWVALAHGLLGMEEEAWPLGCVGRVTALIAPSHAAIKTGRFLILAPPLTGFFNRLPCGFSRRSLAVNVGSCSTAPAALPTIPDIQPIWNQPADASLTGWHEAGGAEVPTGTRGPAAM
jgi:hypothetical protein